MDFIKLYNTIDNNLFIDLSLTLIDANHEIKINLHKIILYSSCIYFEKLLTNCKEKYLNEITIDVPNAFIVYDIIMSFYRQKMNIGNYSEWKYQLELIKCY